MGKIAVAFDTSTRWTDRAGRFPKADGRAAAADLVRLGYCGTGPSDLGCRGSRGKK
jgi:hypothetical protein